MDAIWLPYLFTSCPGGAGLQVHSVCPVITKDEQVELELASRYQPPPSAKPEPSDAELSTFPVKHGFIRFSSGRYGVFRSQYVGKESRSERARYGNYVVEAFVRANGRFPTTPALYLNSPSFRDALAFRDSVYNEDENLERPITLAALPEKAVQARPALDTAALQEAFEEHESLFANILAHICTGRKLVFDACRGEDILFWLECLQSSLPSKLADLVTAVSYTQSSSAKGLFVLQATAEPLPSYERHDFKVDPSIVFFEEDATPPASDFAEFILQARKFSWENAVAFFEFLDEFTYAALTPELDSALLLWQLMQMPGQECSPEEFARALAFGSTYGTSKFFLRALPQLVSETGLAQFFREPEREKTRALFQFINSSEVKRVPDWVGHEFWYFSYALQAFLRSDAPAQAVDCVRMMIDIDPELPGRLVRGSYFDEWSEEAAGLLEGGESIGPKLKGYFQAMAELLAPVSRNDVTAWRDKPGIARAWQVLIRFQPGSGMSIGQLLGGLSPDAQRVGFYLVAAALPHAPSGRGGESYRHALGAYLDALPSAERDQRIDQVIGAGFQSAAVALLARRMFDSSEQLLKTLPSILGLAQVDEAARRATLAKSLEYLGKATALRPFGTLVNEHAKHLVRFGLAQEAVDGAEKCCPAPPWMPDQKEAIQKVGAFASQAKTSLPLRLSLALTLLDKKAFLPGKKSAVRLRDITRKLEALPAAEYDAYAAHMLDQLWHATKSPAETAAIADEICLARPEKFARVFERFLERLREKGGLSVQELLKLVHFTEKLFVGDEMLWKPLQPKLVETASLARTSDLQQADESLSQRTTQLSEGWRFVLTQARARARQREEQQFGRRAMRAIKQFANIFRKK